MPFILLRYTSFQIIKWVGITFAGLLFLTFLVNTIEQVRRLFVTKNINFWLEVKIALFDMPVFAELLFPFAIFFGALIAFLYLSRHQETMSIRASGLSLMQAMKPCLMLGLIFGLFQILALNPLSIFFAERHAHIVKTYSAEKVTDVELGQNGFWVRTATGKRSQIIHADAVVAPLITLEKVYFLNFDENNHVTSRIDGEKAVLEPGKWIIKKAWKTQWKDLKQSSKYYETLEIETHLIQKHLLNAIAEPGKTPFWRLFSLISKFKEQGFPTDMHELYLHKMLATPFLFMGFLLFAFMFSLYIPRLGANVSGAIFGALSCFALYVTDKIFFSFGSSHALPVLLSAWTPPIVALLLAISGLIHREDV